MNAPSAMRSVYRELKARDPGQILIFRGGGTHPNRVFALLDADAAEVRERFGRGRQGNGFAFLWQRDADGERITHSDEYLDELLSLIAAAGRRAAVLEPAGSADARGKPVERIVTQGDFDEHA